MKTFIGDSTNGLDSSQVKLDSQLKLDTQAFPILLSKYGIKRVTEEQQFEAPVTFLVLPKRFLDELISTTPNVFNKEYFTSHSSATTVTNFLNGQPQQSLYILGNGNTTIANNSNIKTVSGSDTLLLADIIYHFIFMNNIWYQVGV
jgi:hypothetical protein